MLENTWCRILNMFTQIDFITHIYVLKFQADIYMGCLSRRGLESDLCFSKENQLLPYPPLCQHTIKTLFIYMWPTHAHNRPSLQLILESLAEVRMVLQYYGRLQGDACRAMDTSPAVIIYVRTPPPSRLSRHSLNRCQAVQSNTLQTWFHDSHKHWLHFY